MAKSTLTPLNNEKLRNYKCNLKLERLAIDEMRNTDLSYAFHILSMFPHAWCSLWVAFEGAALSRNCLHHEPVYIRTREAWKLCCIPACMGSVFYAMTVLLSSVRIRAYAISTLKNPLNCIQETQSYQKTAYENYYLRKTCRFFA